MADLTIGQSSTPHGDDYWDWSVWIEAPEKELAKIKRVVWHLHPTFPNPTVTRNDPKRKFRLDSAGWGVFMILAEIQLKTGKRLELEHMLKFETAPSKATTRGAAKGSAVRTKPRPKVMLSFSAADAVAANELRTLLRSKGAEIVESASQRRGLSAFAMVEEAVKESDGIIALLDETNPSRWVQAELHEAKERRRPVLTIDPTASPGKVKAIINRVTKFVDKLP